MSDRPIGVTAIGVLTALAGIGLLFLGLLSILHGGYSLIFLMLALFEIVISIGLLVGSTWAWYFAIIGWIINIIGGLALSLLGSPIAVFSVLFGIVFIVYFLQKHVKEFFEV